jgi:hypothetical protein
MRERWPKSAWTWRVFAGREGEEFGRAVVELKDAAERNGADLIVRASIKSFR